MKPALWILMICMTCQVNVGYSQHSIHACYGFDCRRPKWNLEFNTGYSVWNTGKKLQEQILEAGFGDQARGTETNHNEQPTNASPELASKRISWDIGITYNLDHNTGLTVAIGKRLDYSISGYDLHQKTRPVDISISMPADHAIAGEGTHKVSRTFPEKRDNSVSTSKSDNLVYGNYHQIDNKVYTVTCSYAFKTGKRTGYISAGPVMAFHLCKTADENATRLNRLVVKPGFQVKYSLPVVQTKTGYFGATAGYTWIPAARIGATTASLHTDNAVFFSSRLTMAKIILSTIHVGVYAGLRL